MTEIGFWRGYWPLLSTVAAAQLSQQVDVIVMGHLGGGAAGAYMLLTRLAVLELVLMTAMSAVASTSVAQAQQDGQEERAIDNALVLAIVAGLGCSLFGLLSYGRMARWLVGETETIALVDAGLFWFSIAAPLRFFVNVAVFILHAQGHGAAIVRWKLIEVLLRAAMNFVLVGAFGAGAAGCFAAAFVISAVSTLWCLRALAAHRAQWRFALDYPLALRFLRSTAWESQRNFSIHLALLTSLALFAAPWIGRYEPVRLNAYSAGQAFILLAFAPLIALTRFLAFRLANLRDEERASVLRSLLVEGTPIAILVGAILFASQAALGEIYGQQGPWWSVLIQALAISMPIRYATNVLRATLHSKSAFDAVAAADSAALWLCAVPLVALGLYLDAPSIAYLSLIAPEAVCAVWLWRRLLPVARNAPSRSSARLPSAVALWRDHLRPIRAQRERGVGP